MNENNVNGVSTPLTNNEPIVPNNNGIVPQNQETITQSTPVQPVLESNNVGNTIPSPVAVSPIPSPEPAPAPTITATDVPSMSNVNPAPVVATGTPSMSNVNPAPVVATGTPSMNNVNPAPVVAAGTPSMNNVNPTPVVATGTPSMNNVSPATAVTPVAPSTTISNPQSTNNIGVVPVSSNQGPTPQTISANIPSGDQVGFVSTGLPVQKKKSKKGLVIAIVLFILTAIGLLAWFVIIPFVMQTLITPEQVFDTTIESLSKELSNVIQSRTYDKYTYNLDLSLDTNISLIEEFSGYSLSGKVGVDTTNKLLEAGFNLKNKADTEYSMYQYSKNNKMYQRYSNYGNLIYVGADSINWDSFTAETLTDEDLLYIVDKMSILFKDSIDEKYLSKNTNSSITVNGETVKATKFTYTIENENFINTVKYMADGILNDEKLFDAIVKTKTSSLSLTDGENIEDYIKEYEDSLRTVLEECKNIGNEEKVFEDETITFSIYTLASSAEFAGIEIYISDSSVEEKIQYSTLNGSYNLFIYYNEGNGEHSENIIRVDGIKNGNTTNVTLKVNDVTYATAKVVSNNEGELSVDYNLLFENIEDFKEFGNVSGNITYTCKDDNKKQTETLSFNVQSGKTYFKLNFNLTTDWTSEVANINTATAVTLSDIELEDVRTKFLSDITSDPSFSALLSLYMEDEAYNAYDDYYSEYDDFSSDEYY